MQSPRFSRQVLFYALLVWASGGMVFHVRAQDTGSAVMAADSSPNTAPNTSPVTPSEARVLQSTAPNEQDTGVITNGRAVSDTPRRFQYTLTGTVRGVYDDNIYNSFNGSGRKTSDFYFTIEPALYLHLGGGDSDSVNTLSLNYQPSLYLFTNHSGNDALQQIIRLQGSHQFGHLGLSLLQDVQLLDGTDLNSLSDPTGHQANTDVTGRNRHQIYTTQLSSNYDITGKIYLSGGGNLLFDEYDDHLISSRDYSGNLYVNYIYSDKLTLGLGGTGGYNTTSPSINDQTYEQINVRVGYSVTAKIAVNASVGAEFRQYGDSGTTNPIYDLSASYQPFDGTQVSLTGSRRTENSASLAGQNFSETTINLSITQRLLQRFYLGVAGGYTNSDYFSTVKGLSATRNDDFFYITPSVDFNITRYWTFGAYYVYREDNSSFFIFSFKDNQVGIRTKLTF